MNPLEFHEITIGCIASCLVAALIGAGAMFAFIAWREDRQIEIDMRKAQDRKRKQFNRYSRPPR